MLKKFLGILTLSSLLLSGAYASDILALVSKGKISDTSAGVKVLSLEEEMQVKGGYILSDYRFNVKSDRSAELYLIFDYGSLGETAFVANHYVANELGYNPLANNISTFRGLCGIDMGTCANPSQNRMVAYLQITNGDYFSYRPTYIVTRTINYTRSGTPYVLFNYNMGLVDGKGQLHKFTAGTSSNLLNYNMVAKEIHNKYKSVAESALGGWSAR